MKFLLTFCVLILSILITNGQASCPQPLTANVTDVTSSTHTLTLTYTSPSGGHKSLYIKIFDDGALVYSNCLGISSSGDASFTTIEFTATGHITASFQPWTGGLDCGGATCGSIAYYPPGGGVLPVTIVNFIAKNNSNNSNTLSWTSLNEINVNKFEIEKQTANGSFIKIYTINATKPSNGFNYTFTDNSFISKINNYRIKMIDDNLSYQYSKTISVKGNVTDKGFIISPNPSTGDTKIILADGGTNSIQVFDNLGRVIKNIEAQNNNIVELKNLTKGNYLVRLINNKNGEATTKKLSVVQ